MSETHRTRVLIIGAGPGGLAASILLASAGLKVKILERLPFVGGWTLGRDFPAAQGRTFRELYARRTERRSRDISRR